MDCRTARLLLDFAQPRSTELEPSEAEALHHHLAGCPDCGPLAQAERAFDERIGPIMRDVPVPDGLRSRVLRRLANEREGWYWRRLRWSAGIAAAIALLTFGGFWYRGRHLPIIDPEKLVEIARDQRCRDPHDLETEFRAQGIRMAAPASFAYRYLAFYGLAEFENKTVPQLVFFREREPALARVYVLNDQVFDMKSLQAQAAQPPADSGGFTVKVFWYPERPQFAYVVVYTGGPEPWFLDNEPPPAT